MVDTIHPDVNWDTFNNPVLFFDGYCHLCQASVKFVLRHERAPELLFATLNSDTAKRLLPIGFSSETVVLFVNGEVFSHSTAALLITQYLKPPYCYLNLLKYIPRLLRDAVYKQVAQYRYKWFGNDTSCMIPDDNIKNRFLY